MRKPRPFKQYFKSYRELGFLMVEPELANDTLELLDKLNEIYDDVSHLPMKCILSKYYDTLEVSTKNTNKKIYTIVGKGHSVDIAYDVFNPIDTDKAALLMALAYVVFNDYIDYVDSMLDRPNSTPTESTLVGMKKYL